MEPPPPSYDDVVGTPPRDAQPTAPPREDLPLVTPSSVPPSRPGYDRPGQSLDVDRRASGQQSTTQASSSKVNKAVERYVAFSIANLLRMHIEPKEGQQDPELDVEAQFARHVVRSQQRAITRRRRVQCFSGWLWCIGVIQVIVYLVLPIAMVVTGIIGADNCPFRNSTIIGYLIAGGVALGLTVASRIIPSLMTCCKNRNVCKTRESTAWAGWICACECFFCLLFVANLVLLFLGTYWVFDENPPSSCESSNPNCDDYCSSRVYFASAFYVITQYVLYVFSALYLCLVFSCHYYVVKE